jgi:alkyl hydroperoxide reductase subunit F
MQNESQKKYELIIIGGGPAGSAAAVYAGRKKINTLVIKKEWGGQSVVSPDIHNWIGTKSIAGDKLASDLKEHVENYKSDILEIVDDEVIKVEKMTSGGFLVTGKSGKTYNTKTILITSGSIRRKLEVPGADRLEHKGLTYCASCDGLFFAGLDVVVVGAGNAGFESAQQLLAYCKSVTILVRTENIRADELTVEAVKKHPNAKILLNTESVEVLGEKKVEGLKIKNIVTGVEETLNVQGIFVEIGQIPNTKFVDGLVNIDKIGKIEIEPWTQKTSETGIWAAGDCTNIRYHQNNIAAGDGVKALEDIYQYIKTNLSL